MAAPIVIKSTDPGAPVVAGIDSCIIALLDQYLLPLGWTKPFSGTNKAVYRPPNAVGNRLFYQVLDGVNVCGGSAGGYNIRCFESMSDIDTGSGMSPKSGYFMNRTKALHGTTSPRPWVLIADGYGFWLGIEATSGVTASKNRLELNYTGEGILMWDDPWFSVLTGQINTSANPNARYPDWQRYNYNSGCVIQRPITGDATNIGVTANCFPAGSDREYMGINNPADRDYPWRGNVVYTRPIIKDSTSINPRGYLPGLYEPFHGGGLTRYQIISDGARQLMALDVEAGYDLYLGWLFIDIGEGYRP